MFVLLLVSIVIYLSIYFSGLPYWLAPSEFYVWNTVVFVLINAFYLYKYRKNNIFSFEFLFALSFWVCCFSLYVVMDKLDPSIQTHSQMLYFSDHLLCRACSLSMLGYLCYMVGAIPRKSYNNSIRNVECRQSPAVNKVLNALTTMFIMLFFVLGGGDFINSYDQSVVVDTLQGGRFGRFGMAMTFYTIFINISSVSNFVTTKYEQGESLWSFIKKLSPLFIINVLVMSIFFLMCGYRSGALQILLPFFAMMAYKGVLKSKQAVVAIALGFVAMVFIGQLRSRTSTIGEISEEMTLFSFLEDFDAANAATPSLIEYVDFYGNAQFKNAPSQILAIIPFLQQIVFGVFGDDFLKSSSSSVYTNEICHSYYSGMGTNVIGDLYYTGGFWCVLALMLLLGWIVRKTSSSTNKYVLLVSLCLIGNAVFMPRVEFFYIARSCGLSVIIYWLVNIMFPVRVSRK